MKKTQIPQKLPQRKDDGSQMVFWLAMLHRYLFLPVLVIVALIWRSQTLLCMGVGFIVFSVYTFIGYKCRWTHIYCSFQNMQKQQMSPNNINWSSIRLSTVYKMPMAFGILGAIMVIYQLFYL